MNRQQKITNTTIPIDTKETVITPTEVLEVDGFEEKDYQFAKLMKDFKYDPNNRANELIEDQPVMIMYEGTGMITSPITMKIQMKADKHLTGNYCAVSGYATPGAQNFFAVDMVLMKDQPKDFSLTYQSEEYA